MNRYKEPVYVFSFMIAVALSVVLAILKQLGLMSVNYRMARIITGLFGEEMVVFRNYYDVVFEKPTAKAILALPSFGCAHYFKSGGCAMCGFNKEIEKYGFRRLHPTMIILLVKIFFLHLEKKLIEHSEPQEVLIIYMAGSFLNEEELPAKAQMQIVDFFIDSNFRRLAIETRPEYVIKYQDFLRRLVERTNGKEIEVYLGLESSDDRIRNKIIKKALTKKQYQEAIAVINKLGAIVNTYILIGVPGLDRETIVQKAIESVAFAWDSGSKVVSLETYCVQADTPWAKLYRTGELALPSLWDIIKVVKEINKISSCWYLGEFSDWPQPVATPKNCDFCTDKTLKSLADLRRSHELSVLEELPDCYCRT